MHCYACLVETGYADQPACAVCQHCGGGICHGHLVELPVRTACGPAGTPHARLLCQRCYCAFMAPGGPSRSRTTERQRRNCVTWSKWKWWQRLLPRRQQPTDLPSAEEAIATAEQFLKRERHR